MAALDRISALGQAQIFNPGQSSWCAVQIAPWTVAYAVLLLVACMLLNSGTLPLWIQSQSSVCDILVCL